VNGTLQIQQVEEAMQTKTAATGTVTHDWSTGATFYHTSISSNFTCNITNLPTNANKVYTVRLILVQGGTGYYANVLQVAGTPVTINWLNNGTPTAGTNKTEIQTFILTYVASSWSAVAEYRTYG
jgi:hypothetical protein